MTTTTHKVKTGEWGAEIEARNAQEQRAQLIRDLANGAARPLTRFAPFARSMTPKESADLENAIQTAEIALRRLMSTAYRIENRATLQAWT